MRQYATVQSGIMVFIVGVGVVSWEREDKRLCDTALVFNVVTYIL